MADISGLDQGDVNSKESLEKALAGAYAVFAVTNYWEKIDPELEKRQGKLIADVSVVSLHYLSYTSWEVNMPRLPACNI